MKPLEELAIALFGICLEGHVPVNERLKGHWSMIIALLSRRSHDRYCLKAMVKIHAVHRKELNSEPGFRGL